MSRLIVFLYGVLSYLFGVLGLLCIIAVLARVMPWGFLSDVRTENSVAIVLNVILVLVWGVIHSIMARPSFKAWFTKIVPEAAERSTYVLVAGITSIALTGYWQNIDGYLWQIESGTLSTILWGIFGFGWVFLLASTFAINHFDLFGLRQVFYNLKNQPRPPLNFVKRAMYAYIRHPIQTGVLIGVWVTPIMSMTQVILSIGFTIYIIVGLRYEERDLIAEHGESYIKYKSETGMVLPKF